MKEKKGKKEKKKLQYKKVGTLANNCRYTIDYDENGKAKVKWSYVKKDRNHSLWPAGISFLSMIVFLAIVVWFVYPILAPPYYLVNCTSNFSTYRNGTYTNFSFYENVECITSKNQSVTFMRSFWFTTYDEGWSDVKPGPEPPNFFQNLKYRFIDQRVWILFCTVIGAFILWIFLWRVLQEVKWPKLKNKTIKKVEAWRQERNAKNVSWKYKWVFKKVPETNIIEIPVFKNNYLHYKAKGEFNDYLTRIEVKEHPFYCAIKRNKKVEWLQNDGKFVLRFYFSQNPRKGKLEVKWR